MRTLIVLVILAGLGYAGYHFLIAKPPSAKPPTDGPSTSPFAPPIVPPPPPAGGTPAAPADAPPPAEVKADLDKADAAWKQLESAGTVPASSKQAPQLARWYSNVLKGIYNKPGQQAREKNLIETRLKPLGDELFFTRTRYADDASGLLAVHQAQSGEVPDKIAIHYGMSFELLNRLRGREPNDSKLQPGESLKVVKLKDNNGCFLHIDKSDFYLDCYLGGVFARRYPIAHGAKESPTPLGTTKLIGRVFHPKWTRPKDHAELPYGDPENILGPVWMPLSPDGLGGTTGIGLHGYTGADGQMGVMASNGCIRMKNEQALELFYSIANPDRSPTTVEIVE